MSQRSLQFASIGLLVLFAVYGLTMRPVQDDLMYMARVDLTLTHHDSIPSFMAAMFHQWTGRYATLFAQTTLETFEPVTTMMLPALLILVLVILLNRCLRASPLSRLAYLSPLWICCWLLATPQRDMGIFWVSAGVVYYLPLVIAGVAVLLALHQRTPLWMFPLALIAGGFSEVTVVMLALLPLTFGRTFRRYLLPWWAGLAIAFIVMALAPSTVSRMGKGMSLDAAVWFMVTEWILRPERVIGSPLGLVIAFSVGYLRPEKLRWRTVRTAWMLAVLMTLVTMLMTVRGASYVGTWTLALPTALTVIAAWLTGCYVSDPQYQRRTRYIVALSFAAAYLMVLAPLPAAVSIAMQWTQRDAAIRGGETTVTLLDGRDSFIPPVTLYVRSLEVWYGRELEVGK